MSESGALSGPSLDHEDTSTFRKFLCFRIEDELHGFELTDVLEIVKDSSITRVPNAQPWVCGVTNLRGRVTPVIDLRQRLGAGDAESELSWILVLEVVLEDKAMALGALVSSLPEVVSLNENDIQPHHGASGRSSYVTGIGHTETDVVQVVNPTRLVEECIAEETVSE
ncbi:MAG: chemotaxis protein CheW [Pseudomonadota bacterium]